MPKIIVSHLPNASNYVIQELQQQNLIPNSDSTEILSNLNLSFSLSPETFQKFINSQNPTDLTPEITSIKSIEEFFEVLIEGESFSEILDKYIQIELNQPDRTRKNFKVFCKNLPDNFRRKTIEEIREKLNWVAAPKRKIKQTVASQKFETETGSGEEKLESVLVVLLRINAKFYFLKDFHANPFQHLAIKSTNHRQKIRPVFNQIFESELLRPISDTSNSAGLPNFRALSDFKPISKNFNLIKIFGPTSLAFNQSLADPKNSFIFNIFRDNHPNAIQERENFKTQHQNFGRNLDFIVSNCNQVFRPNLKFDLSVIDLVKNRKDKYPDNQIDLGQETADRILTIGSQKSEDQGDLLLETIVEKEPKLIYRSKIPLTKSPNVDPKTSQQ